MTTVYKVYDDEYSTLCGKGQLGEFATQQICNAPDDFLEENLRYILEPKQIRTILKLVGKVEKGESVTSVDHSKLICKVRNYNVREIEIY